MITFEEVMEIVRNDTKYPPDVTERILSALNQASMIPNTAARMCDEFCYFATISRSQSVLDRHCEECPMVKLVDAVSLTELVEGSADA